ncbi:MAG: hypothetical protein FWG42_04890, partial [Clostridiales bacterium]|nr:hypothetical protein [Clostridiales bacterium]
MNKSRKIKRILSVAIAAALLLTLPVGISAGAVSLDDISAASEYFGFGSGNEGDFGITVKRVQVLASGNIQSTYRDAENYDVSNYTVYKGDHGVLAVNGEDPSLYYTTARGASMTDPRLFTFELSIPQGSYTGLGTGDGEFDASKIRWTYADRPLSGGGANAWSQISSVGSPAAVISGGNIVVTQGVQFNAFVNASNSSADNVPYTPYYPMSSPGADNLALMGDWEFKAHYGDGAEAVGLKMIRLSMNDAFYKYEEINDFARQFIAVNPEGGTYGSKGRYLKFESSGTTTENREIWTAVISDSKASVDEYLNVTKPKMNSDPSELKEALAPGSQKAVLFFSAIHGGEVVGPPLCLTLFDRLLNNDTVRFTRRTEADTERLYPTSVSDSSNGSRRSLGGTPEDLEFKVSDFLDKYIVVLTFHGNPDGFSRAARVSAYGYDMNRDASYFSQPETRAAARAFNKWDPIYMVEFHGYYTNYIIDGTTPPYEPNFEVDLIEDYLVRLCDSIGMSVIGKSPHKRYVLPTRDVVSGWDNGSTIYTPPMSMLFGSIGSTIEFPNATQDSVDAGVQGIMGLFNFCIGEWEGLVGNKLEFKRRAIENEDRKDLVDPLLVNVHPLIEEVRGILSQRFTVPENMNVGRPRKVDADGNELSFFPEYFVIPVDPEHQRSSGAAFEALDILSSCGGVKLEITTEPVLYNGVAYPEGTYVINMHQGARTFANTMLYEGYDASIYPSLYDSIVISYPELRGFDRATVYEEDLFKGKTNDVPSLSLPAAGFPGDGDYVVVKNNSADAIRLVNRLLADGKDVYLTNGYVPGASLGDFVAKRVDAIDKTAAQHNKIFGMMPLYVEGFGYGDAPPANSQKIVKPVIGYAGGTAAQYYLDLYEFDDIGTVSASTVRSGANVYMLSNTSPSGALATAISGGVPVVLVGSSNANGIITETANQITTGSRSGEALLRGTYANSSLILANMEKQNTIYTMNGSNRYISYLPGFMKPLAVVATGDDYFQAGRVYPLGSAADYKGKTMIASGIYTKNGVDIPMTTIMNNVFSKAGSQLYYRIVANAMFAYASGVMDVPRPTVTYSAEAAGGLLEVSLNYLAEDTAATTETVAVKKYKVTGSKFEPAYDGSAGWKDYAGALEAAANAGLPNYVHWYVENSAGASNQGFFTLPQNAVKYVGASLSVDAESDIDKNVEVCLTLHKAENVLSAELEFEVDGNMLSGVGIETLAGFTVIDGIIWRYAGGNTWKGSVTIGYPAGSSTGLTSAEPVAVAKLIFAPRAAGDTTINLTGFRAVVLEDEQTAFIESVIIAGEA